jgi:hypothetical protein
MTRTNARSLDANVLRRLHIAAFTFIFLLFSQIHGSAQTVDCPLCPTNGGRDTLPPHLQCLSTYNAYLDSVGFVHISPLVPVTLIGDNCPSVILWANQTRYYCVDKGVKNMILFAQDSAGNMARCTTRVTIIDTIRSKVVNCSRDTTFRLSSGQCSSPNFSFATPTTTDNCDAPTTMVLKSALPSGSPFPSGVSTVLFESLNANGVKSTCSFKVTVNQFVPPTGSPICPATLDVNIGTPCQTSLVARDLLIGNNLHCLADYRLTLSYNSVLLLNNTITSTYSGKIVNAQITDLQTNAVCNTNISVKDIIAPIIAAPNDIEITCAQINANGIIAPALTGIPTILVECSATTLAYTDAPLNPTVCNGGFTTAPTGFPTTLRFDTAKAKNAARMIIREFTITDPSGNAAKTKHAIYLRKSDLTLVVIPANITVQCTGNGVNTLPDSAVLNGVKVVGTGNLKLTNGASLASSDCKITSSYQDRRTNTTTGYTIIRTWTLVNACTNERTIADQVIVVTDNPPVIACKTNVTATLSATTRNATVTAQSLVASLTDACTPTNSLMVRIQRMTNGMPWPDSVQVTFNCNDIGTLPVEILVKDESGMMSKCQATVVITDPNTVCRAPTQPAIIGKIETEEGRPIVSNVMLKSDITPTIWQFNRASSYNFTGMPRGDDCALTPSRDTDLLNGVTTLDVALMSRHILDIQPIKSALKQIAADVNADGSVDAIDLVITRRMVLRILSAFPNNKSWHFVPKVYQFPAIATTEPMLNFPEFIQFLNLTDTFRTADFWAVKTGDLNGTATGPAFRADGQVDVRGSRNPLIINATDALLEKDKTYDIDISSDKMDADGFQFTLNYDKNALKILSIEQGELSNFDASNYALFPSEGKATVSWNSSSDSKASPMNIFRLRLSAKQPVRLRDALRMTSDLTPAEAFSLAGDTRSVELKFKGVPTTDFNLFQNDPNPTANGATNIRFRLPEASEARLTLYDISGKILKTDVKTWQKGDNTWRIEVPSVSGVILYRLDTPTDSATRRMMVGQ